MYVPESFRETSIPRLQHFIEQHSFATIITPTLDGLFCSHVPVIMQPQAGSLGTLLGHFAKPNPHASVVPTGSTLCVFQGPHAYISPGWVNARNAVPTWNYVAVHARGQLVLHDDPDWLRQLFGKMVDRYESPLPEPWSLGAPEPHFLDQMIRGTIGFEISIEQLEGKWKLSQNHPAQRRREIAAGLQATGRPVAEQLADLMLATCEET